jgi:hypothetical protein
MGGTSSGSWLEGLKLQLEKYLSEELAMDKASTATVTAISKNNFMTFI